MGKDRFDIGVIKRQNQSISFPRVFPSFVRLGDQNLYRDDDGAVPKDYEIEDFIVHPEYKRRLGKYNDIALIKLAKEVKFNRNIRPACLYDKEEAPSKPVIATGFGSTGVGKMDKDPRSDRVTR